MQQERRAHLAFYMLMKQNEQLVWQWGNVVAKMEQTLQELNAVKKENGFDYQI